MTSVGTTTKKWSRLINGRVALAREHGSLTNPFLLGFGGGEEALLHVPEAYCSSSSSFSCFFFLRRLFLGAASASEEDFAARLYVLAAACIAAL